MKNNLSSFNGPLGQVSVSNTLGSLRNHLSDNKSSKEYIHKIRVDIKHLRAWLKLERNIKAKPNWKDIDRCLSSYAKQLGSIRDDQATNIILDSLLITAKTNEEQEAISYVRNLLVSKYINNKIDLDLLNDELLVTLETYEKNFVAVASISKLKKGLSRTVSKCNHFAEKAFKGKGSDYDLHELRKWIKNFYYQSLYTDKICCVDKKHKNMIHKLGDKLGIVHDLIIIKERIDSLEQNKKLKIVHGLIVENITLIVKGVKRDYKKLFHSSQIKNISSH